MTKELLAGLVALVGLGSVLAGGVWHLSRMESRIEALEADREWRSNVNSRLDVNDQRWAKHFNLWGEEIRAQETLLGGGP